MDPTWLSRRVSAVEEKKAAFTTPKCHYKPLFGEGDPDHRIAHGVARYGEVRVEAGGECEPVSYPAEEQIYVILEGQGSVSYGGESVPVRKNDFMYLPPGVKHGLAAAEGTGVRAMLMGFRIPAGSKVTPPPKLLIANLDNVEKREVPPHPRSTLYQLMMGDIHSQRDKIAAGHIMISLYVMEFAPGGTNFPHHHDREEEIYLVLDGAGDMVAGDGGDGRLGRHPAKAGDAYFFRLNCQVGFYNGNAPGHILAVRSTYPFSRK